jgi:hypothetical protein
LRNYDYKFSKEHIKIFINSIIFTTMAFIPLYIWSYPIAYFSGGIIFILATTYSIYELNKRIDIYSYIAKIKTKFLSR